MRVALMLCLLVCGGISWAGPSGKSAAQKIRQASPAAPDTAVVLDTALVQALYQDGEFDQAVGHLEQARQKGLLRTRADSIFAFKYLAVMYAATYATVERGKQLMVMLLRVDPEAGILDLHASDMIYMIFRNVQLELAHSARVPDPKQERPAKQDTVAASRKTAGPDRRWLYWATGTAALAAGVGAILYFNNPDHPSREGTPYEGGLE